MRLGVDSSRMAAFEVHSSGSKRARWLRYEAGSAQEEAPWRQRLRYWWNSFRGFAAFDVRGIDPR